MTPASTRSRSRPRTRLVALATAAAAVLLLAPRAGAFCGFYVAGSGAQLLNRATMVVMMREGTRTVLAMQNHYEGPPQNFAMVVPVPVVLQRENVRTLPHEVFQKVERIAAPRLVEYWEQDPCPRGDEGTIGLGSIGTIGRGSGAGSGQGYGSGAGLGVRVEARFAVGEYEIVVLSARDSSGLDTWLRRERYNVPAGAGALLAPYVRAGMKFFVARVNASRVRFVGGRARLSPLRFHYDSPDFSLPIRLGLLNSPGTQDLIVHVLSRGRRFEVANRPNVTIPTNLEVTDAARGRFGEFYAALFDQTVARNPNAVVTEYAWDAGTCDPCPEPPLNASDLLTLGADVLPSAGTTSSAPGTPQGLAAAAAVPSVTMPQLPTVRGSLPPEVAQRVARRRTNHARYCYERQLAANPWLAGTASLALTVGVDGRVTDAQVADDRVASPALATCLAAAGRHWVFPSPTDGTPDVVTVHYRFATSPSPGPSSTGGFGGRVNSGFVLTRLHTRYGPSTSEDLVFRETHPLAGGREFWLNGQLEQTARSSSSNNFQARYAIRHPWTGPIQCAQPRRGVWGGPPPGVAGSGAARVATDLAFVARGGVGLAQMIRAAPPVPPAPPVAPPAAPRDAGR